MYSAFDLFLDGQLSRDWNAELKAFYDELRAKAEKGLAELEAKRVVGTKPSLPLAALAGVYEEPLFGTVRFDVEGEALRVKAGLFLSGRAEPWHFDTFRVVWDRKLYGTSWVTFRLAPDGSVKGVEIDGTLYPRQQAPPRSTGGR
jgi:hypothetical protein